MLKAASETKFFLVVRNGIIMNWYRNTSLQFFSIWMLSFSYIYSLSWSMNSIFVSYLTSTAFQEGGPCTFLMIQVQNFQSLLQAKIYLHFALRNSLFSAPRKVDILFLNYRCQKGCQSTSCWTVLKVWNIKWYTLAFYTKISKSE